MISGSKYRGVQHHIPRRSEATNDRDLRSSTTASPNGNGQIGKWVLWVLGGLGAFAAMGVPMIAMMVFMGQMTESMGRMVVSVDRMSDDVGVMKESLVASKRIRLLHDFAITRPGVEVTSLEDLRRKRVLGYVGALWYLGDEFRSAMKDNPQYREIDNHRAQVRLLLQGRVDVIVADRLLISWYVDYLRGEGKTPSKGAVTAD